MALEQEADQKPNATEVRIGLPAAPENRGSEKGAEAGRRGESAPAVGEGGRKGEPSASLSIHRVADHFDFEAPHCNSAQQFGCVFWNYKVETDRNFRKTTLVNDVENLDASNRVFQLCNQRW